MMANIFDVARYILNKNGQMSTWKLQKLCYYSQAWSLAWTGDPIFPEDFEAWSNGPVCRELFYAHKGKFVVSESDIPKSRESGIPLTDDQVETIDRVLETYGKWQPYELREQTHTESPWKDARGDLPVGERCQTVITKPAMGEYYGSL